MAMGKTFNLMVRALGLVPFRDTQCGFKGFRRAAAAQLFSRQKLMGFAFDVEILAMAVASNMKVREQPVRWTNDEDSRVHILFSPLAMIKDILLLRMRLWMVSPRRCP